MALTKAALIEQRKALIAYMRSKITAADWHAVQDSASDIREIEAKLSVLDMGISLSDMERQQSVLGASVHAGER